MATIAGAILQSAGLRPGASGIMFQSDNAADIGQSAANRPRDLYVGRNSVLSGTLIAAGVVTHSSTTLMSASAFIGDTANANVTLGLTVNQGPADDHIFAEKSSDISHGMTDVAEDDTYGYDAKVAGATGGRAVVGFAEGTRAFQFGSFYTNDNTTKTTAADAAYYVDVRKKSGTSLGAPGADANLFVIAGGSLARFIFDNEGSAHADVEWTTFDEHNDLAVIEDLETILAPRAVKRQFGEVVKHDRKFFERAGLLHDVRDVGRGRMRGMLNTTRTLMLSLGAIRQVGGRVGTVEAVLRLLVEGDTEAARRLLPA